MAAKSDGGRTLAERLIARDRLIVAAGLILLIALSWWWLLIGAGTGMSIAAMTTSAFPPPLRPAMAADWTLAYGLVMIFMWWVMMIAMMTPSAAPTILLYGVAHRHEARNGRVNGTAAPTFAFLVGYLAIWLAFSIAAATLQWALERLTLVHPMLMWSVNPLFSGLFMLVAGLYQFSPAKRACLNHCRSPAHFLAGHYRPGARGAFVMGLRHGAYCLGCCALLMGLLFVGGIMNLLWISGLAILVLAEKLLPRGDLIAKAAGALMMVTGGWLLLGAAI